MAKSVDPKPWREDAVADVSASGEARRINNTSREQLESPRTFVREGERSGILGNSPQVTAQADSSASGGVDPAQLFGKEFLWGASTAGHQVEGGNYDQWTVWELAHARELASTAEKRLNWLANWEKLKAQAETPENYVSGKGVDHYRRYREDFDILKSLNMNAFRFGIEWSRVEPEEGVWDKTAIDHYHNYIAELNDRGIEPILNLWHWTHPVWFEEKGAFSKSGNIGYFLRYVSKMAEEFGNDITYIITLNEPNVYTSFSYLTGEWPPQTKSPLKALAVYRNLVKAHKYSYVLLKKQNPSLQIGIAAQLANSLPKRKESLLDKLIIRLVDYAWNWWFLNRIKKQQDFVGVNYYFTQYYEGVKQINPPKPVNDLGWYMEPGGIGEVVTKAWLRYHKPVMITENGVADGDDRLREWWLKETLQALMQARKAGVNLIGYMHWSLLDNFEWKYGWWPKFGLIKVDRENGMKRTIRPSARWWAKQLEILQKSDKA